jgi:hypothetical protein
MATTNHRTWQKHRVGHVFLSIRLDPLADGPKLDDDRQLAQVTRQLVALTDAQSLPATWAVSDPAYSAATPLVVGSPVKHELAILGDANWLGPTAGRTRFARELARRVSQARSAGIDVTTLDPRVAPVERHIDLIVKQRLTTVVGVKKPFSSRQILPPRAIHFGVWEMPITAELALPSNWRLLGRWKAWRRIRLAAASAAAYHVVIDAPALLEDAQRGLKTVAWLLRRIAELRKRGLVHVETLRAAAARMSKVPATTPQHSILRRAA